MSPYNPISKDSSVNLVSVQTILGFDPGRDKCGVAVLRLPPNSDRQVLLQEVVDADRVKDQLPQWCQDYQITQVVMGNQTTAKQWHDQLNQWLPSQLTITLVDERNSTAEARQRYWQLYPPRGLTKLLPEGLRTPPRQVDDIVAILLIERYLATA